MSIVPDDPDLAMHWTRWLNRKNAASRDHLIVHYSPLVKFVAGRIGAGLPNSVDPGDLVSSGVFGLIDAIDRYDPERAVKFETFAAPRIRGAIYDGLRQLDWVPRSVRSRAREVERAFAQLEHELGRAPTDDELAEKLHIGEDELARWLASIAATTIGPLDRAVAAGYEPESVESEGMEHPVAAVEDRELRDIMKTEILKLPEREKLVLSLYYDEGLTLAEIGNVLGVTESRVSQIHTKSVLHLRSRMAAAGVG
ncbi:MAG: FliA/WhiG family RNA polymerase sigma factor [Ilumatobacteraceae bacterium]|nr:FliA/WhiG family RNA polymerase sigma factor [Ilumatobacteraceae bacterium]